RDVAHRGAREGEPPDRRADRAGPGHVGHAADVGRWEGCDPARRRAGRVAARVSPPAGRARREGRDGNGAAKVHAAERGDGGREGVRSVQGLGCGSSRLQDCEEALCWRHAPMTSRYLRILVVLVSAALIASGVAPYDRTTWWLEIFPVLIAGPVLVLTARRFPLTPLTYTLLAVHALVLIIGGHYTYARVPLGFWVQHLLGLARNDYDRLGHFVQGFVPAILIREILLRTSPLRPGRWLFVLVTASCLAFSACYEFFEWWSALAGGHAADAFLGTQGDVWDTQWDMFCALIGAITAQLVLSNVHDRALSKLLARPERLAAA